MNDDTRERFDRIRRTRDASAYPSLENTDTQGDPLPWRTFALSIGTRVELHVRATDSGRTWNGYAIPILTADQASIVGSAIGELTLLAGECDGLTWEIVR